MVVLFFLIINAGFSLSSNDKIIVNYMMYRGIYLNVDNLNSALRAKGYPEVNSYCDSYGIGNHNILKNNIIFGINYHEFYGNDSKNSYYSTKLTGNWELLSLGYIVFNTEQWYIYPIFNFGYGKLNIDVVDSSLNSFDKILNQQQHLDGVSMKTSSYLFEPALGIDYYIENKVFNALYVGFRTGYMMSPINYGWSVNGISINGGPETQINGFFLSFSAGMLL